MMNKKAWIRIVEAFITILLIMGVVLIVIGRIESSKSDMAGTIYRQQIGILREIQISDDLREDILNPALALPVSSDNDGFPVDLENKINSKTPGYLECKAKICEIGECNLQPSPDKSIYSESALITVVTTSASFSPRQLKLFCWIK